MTAAAITCTGVWKSYRVYHQRAHTLKERILSRGNSYEEFWALKGIDAEVPAGTTVGIIGANGSGKSTLLKTFARILTPNKGTVEVKGVMSSLLELGTGFHPELTGRENVYLGGSLLGLTRRDVDARYDSIVEFADIERFMDMPVKNYSTGMYARLAFSVAISADPDILVVDEVLSVGDQSFQLRCHERISEFREEGRTIVLVSHSLDTIRSLCSHVIWLDGGVVREAGGPQHVAASYLGDVRDHDPGQQPTPKGAEVTPTGDIEIVDVRFLDSNGAESMVFKTCDELTIRLSYRASRPVESCVCAVALYRAEDHAYVFGQNSAEAALTLSMPGSGDIEFTVPQLPLLTGAYLVTVALHSGTTSEVYDMRERTHSFWVELNPALPVEVGMVHVPSTWTHSSSSVPV